MLDEPTTHLDVRHVLDLLAIVRRLAELEGTAVLAIHHDLNLAASTQRSIGRPAPGAVVASGPPASVVTPALLREVYGVEADVSTDPATGRPSVRIGVPSEPAAPLGRRAHVVGGAGRGAPILRRLAEAGYDVSVGVLHGVGHRRGRRRAAQPRPGERAAVLPDRRRGGGGVPAA